VQTFIAWIQGVAQTLGAPGLFIIGFLDSSFLSLPQINDLLLVLSVTRAPHLMPLYASMSTLGSLAGCLVMYGIGRKGGDALLRRRFKGRHTQRAMAMFDRYGILAVTVPALLPPPAPFKLFVILAGVARVSVTRFIVAVAIGRGVRYFAEGLLAVWYGERALEFISAHGREVSLGFGLLVLVGGVLYVLWRSRAGKAVDVHEPPALAAPDDQSRMR
jgi:membrane protein YqaA with SNARE-associated domain